MSNAFLRTEAGDIPEIPTDFTTDDGTAIPSGNNLNLNGVSSEEDDVNGILTRANPDLSDNLEIVLTNRLQGSGTTVGAATADLITFSLGASAAVYRFSFEVVGRAVSTGEGVGYTIFGTARTDGATATEILSQYSDYDEDAALIDSDVDFLVSGNNIIIRATGAAGLTMNFLTLGTYLVVS